MFSKIILGNIYIYIYIRFGTKIIDKEGLIDITNFE